MVPINSTVEALLPELTEPRVPGVGIGVKVEVVLVEIRDVGRMDADGYAAPCLTLVSLSDVASISPAVTAKERVSVK